MPIGDVLAKLGKGETLSAGELDQLRVRMNFIEATTSRAGEVMSSQGPGLNPGVFQNSGMFSLLPHECASMRFDTQAIGNDSTTTPVSLTPSGATWSYGFRNDTANHRIYTSGRPGDMVLLITAWWQWGINATGNRILTWNTDDGGAVSDRRASFGASLGTYNYIANIRRVASAETYHYLTVYQNSGGDLDGDGLLVVAR